MEAELRLEGQMIEEHRNVAVEAGQEPLHEVYRSAEEIVGRQLEDLRIAT